MNVSYRLGGPRADFGGALLPQPPGLQPGCTRLPAPQEL